jgi:hypothetical protein
VRYGRLIGYAGGSYVVLDQKFYSKLGGVISSGLLLLCLSLGLGSCRDASGWLRPRVVATEPPSSSTVKPSEQIIEVAPPSTIGELRQKLDKYQPQVQILSPRSDQVLTDTTVEVQLQVNDLPLFKNKTLGMGPHLHLILDNEPYQAIYDVSQPIVLEDLNPGTHTLRVFASRPWHESFKNESAYAQTTFHLFTKTNKNNPDPALPLLTYSRPKGEYGAEPIMLDFYLTNAPLHLVAQESLEDKISDWRVQVTINGQSFPLDNWQPIYLKGFKKGNNWVQLAFLDEQGQEIENAFNNTVRLINYNPGGKDTLSKLVRGELTTEESLGIVDPTVEVVPAEEPTLKEVPEEVTTEETPEVVKEVPAELSEAVEEPVVEEPVIEEAPEEVTTEETPEVVTPPAPEKPVSGEEVPTEEELETTEEAPAIAPVEPAPTETEKQPSLKSVRNLFKRFRKEKLTEAEEIAPSPAKSEIPPTEEVTPAPEITPPPAKSEIPQDENTTEKQPETTSEAEETSTTQAPPSLEINPDVETKPEVEPPPVIEEPEAPNPGTPKSANKQSLESDLPPTLPEIVEDAPANKSPSQREVEEKVMPETSPNPISPDLELEELPE